MKLTYMDGEVMALSEHETLEAAILDTIKHWPEGGGLINVYWIKDEEDMVAATIAPVGSDKAIVVYVHGQIDTYENIHYLTDKGEWIATSFCYNGSATPTILH